MLFDLQGKRRRVVQATYLTLAILMGGGLVFFGIGSDVQGGLSDAFSGGGGGDDGNSALEKRIERNEKAVAAAPAPTAATERARKALVRDYYQLAVAQTSEEGAFNDDAKADLRKAAANWNAYLKRSLRRSTPHSRTSRSRCSTHWRSTSPRTPRRRPG